MRPFGGLAALAAMLSLAAGSSQPEDCPPEDVCRLSADAGFCSGRGTCHCGECHCEPGFSGRHCECDDGSCRSARGLLCGGPGQGRCLCGQCLCQPGWTGHDCSCPTSAVACAPPGVNLTCSGRGNCICGVCECHWPHEGAYCECSSETCARHAGLLCGGPDHGICRCGVCVCHSGWQGPACECPASTLTCVEPSSGLVCADNGVCECGQCRCFDTFSGEHCDECPTCVGKCASFRNCVECLAFNTGPLKSRCSSTCSHVKIALEENITVSDFRDRLCSFFTGDCRYQFVYSSRGGPLRVQRQLNCPVSTPSTPELAWPWSGASSPAPATVPLLLSLIASAVRGS